MNKILIILILLFYLQVAQYEPILINKKYDFKFDDITYEGDEKINKINKK